MFALLWAVKAHPDSIDLGSGLPESNIFFQIAGPLQHRSSNGPMDVDFAVADVFQNAGVGRRFAPGIMVLRQSVDGDSNPAPAQSHPLFGNGNDSARHNQGKNILFTECRQYAAEFAMANHRLTTDQ